jgi:Subtilase family
MDVMNLLFLVLYLSFPLYREPVKIPAPKIETDLVWVYFTDKGFTTEFQYKQALKTFSPKLSPDALERRVRHNNTPADFNDLPVYQKYLDEIQAIGGNLRAVSNWLNAASFRIPKKIIPQVNALPYVYDIKPVVISKIATPAPFSIKRTKSNFRSSLRPEEFELTRKEDTALYRRLYGPSLEQVAMLGVPTVYFKGYTGSKVKIGILDTGLKRKNQALSHFDSTVVLEHDFLAGDDIFHTTGANFTVPNIVTELETLPRIKEPNLSYSAIPSDTQFLFYTADNFYGLVDTMPRRALYTTYTTDAGTSWHAPIALTPATLGLGCRFPFSVTSPGRTYVAWQSSPSSDEQVGNIYFGYFDNIQWQNMTLLNLGKSPNLFEKGDSLYLTFYNLDTIYFRTGTISPDSIHWEETHTVGVLPEIPTSPKVILDSLNEVEVFVTGLKSSRIYHYRSSDGISFEQQSNPVDTLASGAQVYVTGPTIHLFYKDYSDRPLVRLSYKQSSDGGQSWSSPISITPNLLSLGTFSFRSNDKLYAAYETYGSIYLAQSTDGTNWSNTPVDTQDFLYCPLFAHFNNNLSLVWFRRGDNNTDYEPGEDNILQADHGTHMTSIIAGYKSGEIVGVAPGADLIIAKTEFFRTKSGNRGQGYPYEFTVEEDMWIEGLEWAERHGAQIISSSLGYRSWYGDAGLDGKTAPISIAAGLAAERGLVIVTAMGNRGSDSTYYPWPTPYIVAPGDAYGVITAGGVTKYRAPWRGSGTGPTIDGRMKPELVAMSDTVVVVMPDSADGIEGSAGTSDATALIAGCCALILEAHPDWDADSVKQALFSTASDKTPGTDTVINDTTINIFGYGIPNVDSVLKFYPSERPAYASDQLLDPYPNPFIPGSSNDKIYFPFFLSRPTLGIARISVYTLSGEFLMDTLLPQIYQPGRYGVGGNRDELTKLGAFWDGKNDNGKPVASGLYFVVLRTGFATDVKKFAVVR